MHFSWTTVAYSLLTLLVAVNAGTAQKTQSAKSRPIIGAIRWDAWHHISDIKERTGSPVEAMEKSLGPNPYHWRLPFFGKVISENQVRIDGYTQSIVDKEIEYAKAGGLDYWAFLLYEPNYSMSQGLSLYLSSTKKNKVKFCTIASGNIFGNADQFSEKAQRILDLMKQPTYQKVNGDRPLLYLFDISDGWIANWGGETGARKLFDQFRTSCKEHKLNNPYIVLMEFSPERGHKVGDALGADAISSYAHTGTYNGAVPYSALAKSAAGFWEACAATGSKVVPLAMAGWDRRPRIEHPVPWETYQKPMDGIDNFYISPTPAELSQHIKGAMKWVDDNPEKAPSRAIIIYAWNEHDEGGWLCPTLGENGKPDNSRLKAIGAMLKQYNKK